VPDGKAGVDAFAVIRDAMKNKDHVALGRIVLINREHVIAIEPLGKGLLGITLRYPYEVRDEQEYFDDIPGPKRVDRMAASGPVVGSAKALVHKQTVVPANAGTHNHRL
jgi:non-homologous end joining protein Ku